MLGTVQHAVCDASSAHTTVSTWLIRESFMHAPSQLWALSWGPSGTGCAAQSAWPGWGLSLHCSCCSTHHLQLAVNAHLSPASDHEITASVLSSLTSSNLHKGTYAAQNCAMSSSEQTWAARRSRGSGAERTFLTRKVGRTCRGHFAKHGPRSPKSGQRCPTKNGASRASSHESLVCRSPCASTHVRRSSRVTIIAGRRRSRLARLAG